MLNYRWRNLLTGVFWLLNLLPIIQSAPRPEENNILDFGLLKFSADVGNGFALRKEAGIDLPFLKIHSKGQVGIGEAIGRQFNDDSDENEERRKKRGVLIEENTIGLSPQRKKRSPCFNMNRPTTGGGGGGDAGGDGGADGEDAAERRRRRNAVMKRKLANRAKASKRAKKGKYGRRRRRRQAEVEDLNSQMDVMTAVDGGSDVGKKISEHFEGAVQKIQGVWTNIVEATQKMASGIKSVFSGGNQEIPNMQPNNDA